MAKLEAEDRRLAEEKFALMRAEKANHAVGFMAGLIGVSRAGCYAGRIDAALEGPPR